MTKSATERSAAFELSWSLSITSGAKEFKDHTLRLEYQITAFEEIYIGDRLWDYDAANRRVPDPFGIYRFVYNGSLRLVFAQSPRPSNVLPRVVYQPLYSRIRASETLRKVILLKMPVDEYSALERDINSPTVAGEVSREFFVMSYRSRSSMDSDPIPPPFETAEEAGYIVHDPEIIISSLDLENVPVKQRTGYIARFPLPGEPAPGPMPPP